MDYVNSHTPEEIARVIQPQFTENDLETITTIVERYQQQDTWKENLVFEQDSLNFCKIFWRVQGNWKTGGLCGSGGYLLRCSGSWNRIDNRGTCS